MIMKYKAGDVVRVKPLEWYRELSKEKGETNIKVGNEYFTDGMVKMCGMEIIVIAAYEDKGFYRCEPYGRSKTLCNDSNGCYIWNYTDEMLEDIVPEMPKKENRDLINEFMQAFMPDWEEKEKELDEERDALNRIVNRLHFIQDNFSEALKNYTDTICRMQRKKCADNAGFNSSLLRDSCGIGSEFYKIDLDTITEAEQPQIFKI
jgi:hypothetical protein